MSCPDCFAGHEHSGTPLGQIFKLHGLDTYVVDPPGSAEPKGIIVIIPDAFGLPFINNKLLADHYAVKGQYKVLLPDFMNGNSAPAWMNDMTYGVFNGAYIWKPYYLFWLLYAGLPWAFYNSPGKTLPGVKAFFRALRANEAAHLPVGAAGFCWGGKHTCSLATDPVEDRVDGKPLFDAAFTAHPSFLKVPADIEPLKLPVSFAIGDKDIQVKAAQIPEVRRIVEGKPEGSRGEVRTYPGAGHGFAVRADHILAEAKQQAEEAEEQCIAWFQRCFAGIKY